MQRKGRGRGVVPSPKEIQCVWQGGAWRSVLVHTGMYQPDQHEGRPNDKTDPATFVASDALEAVEQILVHEGRGKAAL